MLRVLQKNSVLWFLLVVSIACLFAFDWWEPFAGGLPLDFLYNLNEIEAQLAAMNQAEKSSHFWMTLIVDTIFPFAYGGILIGVTIRFSNASGLWLAIPAFLVIPVDLIENTVQLMLLSDINGVIVFKPLLTSTKYTLVVIAALIAMFALGAGLIRYFKSKS